MPQPLFDQLSSQLNFLLLSQRQMILTSAFAIGLLSFYNNVRKTSDFKKIYIIYLSVVLLIYGVTAGLKAILDFEDYLEEVKQESGLTKSEIGMIKRSNSWRYYSYSLISIILFIMVMLIKARNHL